MSFFGGGGAAAANTTNEPKDIEVSDPPSDSISSISFSTAGEFLAVASWNNEVSAMEKKAFPIDPNMFLGPNLRSKPTRRSDTRKGYVPTSRARTRCLLEQSEFVVFESRPLRQY